MLTGASLLAPAKSIYCESNVLEYSRLAELIAIRKGEQYAETMSWIRIKLSFALLSSALICRTGSRELSIVILRTLTLISKMWKASFRNTSFYSFACSSSSNAKSQLVRYPNCEAKEMMINSDVLLCSATNEETSY